MAQLPMVIRALTRLITRIKVSPGYFFLLNAPNAGVLIVLSIRLESREWKTKRRSKYAQVAIPVQFASSSTRPFALYTVDYKPWTVD